MAARAAASTAYFPGVARPELLLVAENVAREKSIEKDDVLQAIEHAIEKAARSTYGVEKDIRASIDRKTGEVRLARYTEVVDPEEFQAAVEAALDAGEEPPALHEHRQIPLAIAQKVQPGIGAGQFLIDPLPPIDFGRVASLTAKQVIVQEVRSAERRHTYEEYRDRVGEIVNGTVKRVDFGNVVVDLGRAETMLRRAECIPRESFQVGDRVRAYIHEVLPENKGPLVELSRTHPGFLSRLFSQEVPEIYDGVIEIKAVARDPGSRAKIAVISHDGSIDPVGACIGRAGARVRPIVEELRGERVDILQWTPDAGRMIAEAMKPAAITRVVLDEESRKATLVAAEDQLSLAIGRRGQNVRLASMLTKWEISLLTEKEDSEQRAERLRVGTAVFVESLNCDEMIAGLLYTEGFTSVQEILETEGDELLRINGFHEELVTELKTRAQEYLARIEDGLDERRRELGVEDAIAEIGLTPAMLVKLGEGGIKTLDDLADLASDELNEILGEEELEEESANAVIMAARAHWFEDGEVANTEG